MNGEKPGPDETEAAVQRHFLAAHAGQFVDWLLGGVKEAMGPSLPPGQLSGHQAPVDGAAENTVKQEGNI